MEEKDLALNIAMMLVNIICAIVSVACMVTVLLR